MKKWLILVVCTVILIGCQMFASFSPTTTPLPGWRTLTSDLLLEDHAFPVGWRRSRDWPKGSLTDVTINHVDRSWYDGGYGDCGQSIWRAYSLEDAKARFEEVAKSYTRLSITPNAFTTLEPLFTPPEIEFSSQVADEFTILCGKIDVPICEAAARYRNYVVLIEADWKRIEPDGRETSGLTYEEFESLLVGMDTIFIELFAAIPSP